MIKFRFTLENFLTPEECKAFIERSEAIGYEESKIRVRFGADVTEVMNKDVRDNERVIFDDIELAASLFERVKQYLPQELDETKEWELLGLNERFRFYRYKDGQQFKQHKDGAFVRNENEISKVTMILYLNEDFEGGEFEYIFNDETIKIKPIKNTTLIMNKEIHHRVLNVTNGERFSLIFFYKKLQKKQKTLI